MKKMAALILSVMCAFVPVSAAADSPDDALTSHAAKVLQCLKDRDFEQLALFVHKDKGVTFSPYAFVEKGAVKLSPAQVKALKLSDEFTWGVSDGEGEPIVLNVEDYFKRFVFGHDFTQAPLIGVDEHIKTGNTLSNLKEVFPGAQFVEYHFPGFDPQFEGMDWVTLRLVFEKSDGQWMLVGVVRDCWTI